MFITQRYTLRHASTIFRRIYWAREVLEKWGNQSMRQLYKEIGCSCLKGNPTSIFGKYLFGRRFEI